MSGSLEPLSTEAIASGMQLYLQQGRKTKIKWHHSLTGNVLKERLWTRYCDLWQTTDNVFRNNPTNDSKPLNQNFYPINTAFPSFTDVILHFARATPPPPPTHTHPVSYFSFKLIIFLDINVPLNDTNTYLRLMPSIVSLRTELYNVNQWKPFIWKPGKKR